MTREERTLGVYDKCREKGGREMLPIGRVTRIPDAMPKRHERDCDPQCRIALYLKRLNEVRFAAASYTRLRI
jgi:hypothetical protein